jgi:NADPH:quinone reductase-like Zn-dependent oxidoreductase
MAISYYRGMATIELKKRFPELKGAMMAVGSSEKEITPLITQLAAKDVKIACFNSPQSLTISGDEPAIDELQAIMQEKQMFNRKLQVDVAYHSHHMKLVAKSYLGSLRSLDPPKSSPVKFHSSLLGHLIDGSKLEPSYWVDNLTESVRFSEALTRMCEPTKDHKTGVNIIVEIGPHSALAGPVKQILKACGANAMKIPYASALVRKTDAVETALALAATLFVRGATLDLGAVNFARPSKQPSLLVDMPRYPWNHKTKYWHESRMMQKHKTRTMPRNDLLGTLANYSNDLEPIWRNILRIDDLPWLRQHKIQSLTLFPLSGFIAMVLEAASQRASLRNAQYDHFELRDLTVSTPLMIADEDIETTIQLRPHQGASLISSNIWDEFRIHSWTAINGWTEHCKGLVAIKCKDCNNVDSGRLTQESEALLQSTITEIIGGELVSVSKSKIYDTLSELGVSYGPSFQGMNDCHASDTCCMSNIMVVDTAQDMPQGFQTNMTVHPAFLEQLIEMYWPILGAGRTSLDTVYLPSSIRRMTISRHIAELTNTPGNSLRAFCKGVLPAMYPKPAQVSMFATASNDSREALITLDNLTISPILEKNMSSDSESHRELCYKLDWEPILQPLNSSVANGITNGISKHSSEFPAGTANGTCNGLSKGPNRESNFSEGEVAIICGDSEFQNLLATNLADALEHLTGKRPAVGALADIKTDGKLCLFLSELDKPLLSSLTLAQFTALQKVLTSVQGILWVVRGAYVSSRTPEANMITGLSRSIRSETLLKFATLDLDSECILSDADTVKAILTVFRGTFSRQPGTNCELEFMERKGTFFTPRIINDDMMNTYVHKKTKGTVLENTLFAQDGRPLQLVIGSPGALETLHFVDQLLEEHLPDNEIEVEVKAIGMNPRDVAAAMGQLETLNFGFECSGIVTKTGNDVTNLAVGDRIAGISVFQGVCSTYSRIKESFAFKISDDMSFAEAASIPVAYSTAHYGLIDLGQLLKEDSVLIHGAGTAVGQAAICLAQMIGAETFVTVGSNESKELVKKAYNMRDDHIFSTHSIAFAPAIRQATDQYRLDIVLNCLPTDADTLGEIWDCLGNFGRFVDIGKQGANARLETARFESNRSYMSLDMISIAVERPKVMKRLLTAISELLKHPKIRPVCPITVLPMSNVEAAFKVLQGGNTDGKLILSPLPGDKVKVCRYIPFPSNSRMLSSSNNTLGNSFKESR